MRARCERDRKAALRKRPAPDERSRKRREWEQRIWRKYKVTPEDVARMWQSQGGACALCFADLNTKVWAIDHHHKSGRFRGILCSWCNHRVLSMCERAGKMRVLNAIMYLGWS